MITSLKIHQLEKRLNRSRKGHFIVWHELTEDGRLIDKNGFVMNKEEVWQIEKEDKLADEMGNRVFFEVSLNEPKLKQRSVTVPYWIDPYKGEGK